MLRIGSMNMLLHGVDALRIERHDSLSSDSANIQEQFTLVLANPPFAGSLDYEATAKKAKNATDALFSSLQHRAFRGEL
jgi:type I restriction enzyme M protein